MEEYKKIYILMNKPVGYVCSAVSDSHKTVYQLLSPEFQDLVTKPKRGQRLHTVGRLDCNTSGLLLFTTDGIFSHKITSSKEIGGASLKKTYRACLAQELSLAEQNSYIASAATGLTLPAEKKFGEQKSAPASLIFLSPDSCTITVCEGKFHEVRRIFRALGNEVTRLERISIGALQLPEDLKEGEWRPLTSREMENLFL